MLRGSVGFETAIGGSAAGTFRCEAWLAGRRIAQDLPLTAATVSGDSGNFVRRTTNMTFAEEFNSGAEALAKTLARPGADVRVWSGIRAGDLDEHLPVHYGVAENPTANWSSNTVTLTSPDLAQRVAFDRFPKPRRSSGGFTVAQQISALWRETLPWVRFIDESGNFTAVSDVVWERGRNDAIDDLATAIGCETYLRPDGSAILRPIASVIGIAAHRIREGVSLADASVETDWASVRNHWVVTADRGDGASYFGEAADLDPESPTYVFGPMRRRTGFYASSLFTTNAQCAATARGLLARSQGARITVGYEGLLHPGVEAGDRHDVVVDGTTHRIVLDSFSFDLFGATMTGHGRSARAVAEEEG